MNGKCYCGKESSAHFTWCDDCLARNRKSADALLRACCSRHGKGGGGAAMCICGAGGGGSDACDGLSLLQSALQYGGKHSEDVMRLFGWGMSS